MAPSFRLTDLPLESHTVAPSLENALRQTSRGVQQADRHTARQKDIQTCKQTDWHIHDLCTHTNTHTSTHTYTHIYTLTHTPTHKHTLTHTYTHTHTYIHTYTHTM